MHDLASTLNILNELWNRASRAEVDRRELMQSNLPQAMKDEQDKIIQQQIAQIHGYQERLLDDLVHFPPHAVEHFANLAHFHQTAPYLKSSLPHDEVSR